MMSIEGDPVVKSARPSPLFCVFIVYVYPELVYNYSKRGVGVEVFFKL